MGRSPCCDESGLKKGPWTPEEDDKLIKHIQKHGHGSWRALPKLAGLNRCGKSCRLRWTNYLRPDIKRGKFSQEEEQTILNLHAILGNKWSTIASQLPGRTDNEIKNFWNTHLKKKLIQMGFDPMTHRPRTDLFSTLPQLIALANLFDNPSWPEDHAFRLNHCLHALLQTLSPSSPTFPNNTAPADMETFGLMNSLNDASSSILSLLEARPPSQAASGFLQESMPGFPHLPNLQAAPCGVTTQNCSLSKGGSAAMAEGSDFGAVLSRGDISPGSSSPWMMPLNTSPSSTPSAVAPVARTPAGNDVVDACSPSGYGGAQMWSELLNDPIFHDLA